MAECIPAGAEDTLPAEVNIADVIHKHTSSEEEGSRLPVFDETNDNSLVLMMEIVENDMKTNTKTVERGVTLVAHADRTFQSSAEDFLKGCKWSPDGSCVLANSGSNSLQVFDISEDILTSQHASPHELTSLVKVPAGELVYDFCWCPIGSQSSSAAAGGSSYFVTTARDHPIHLWDATSGQLKCSYRAFDNMDELSSAYSVMFSCDGQRLFCGFNKMIRVFDVNRPGRICQSRPTYLKQGQSGIISCMAMCKASPNIYAAGSYNRTVALYNDPTGDMLCMFQGQQGGVTHLLFSPDGNRLFSGGRKDPEILCWDMRNTGEIIFTLQRQVTTNQRIYFDIDSTGRYIVSGNQDGTVLIWDSLTGKLLTGAGNEPTLEPTISFNAHSDTVSSISCHPTSLTIATGSGQRHFTLPTAVAGNDSDSSDDSTSEMEDNDKNYENSLKIWSLNL